MDMTLYETLSTFAAVAAIVVSLVSLMRTRKISQIQIDLARINSDLAKKQLDKISESEEREGQPIFVIRTTRIIGIGYDNPDYRINVTIHIENTGCEFIESRFLSLVTLRDGLWQLCKNASLKRDDINRPLLGEHSLVLKPDSQLYECKILISYLDRLGEEKMQEFEIFPEGNPNEKIPSCIFFKYKKTYKIIPYQLWKGP